MLDAKIIKPVEESEWISPMVVQDKKTGEVQICVDLIRLNDACMHDPFPTPFTDEALEGVGGQEMYSFTYGFWVITKSESPRRIDIKQCSSLNGDISNIQLCLLG